MGPQGRGAQRGGIGQRASAHDRGLRGRRESSEDAPGCPLSFRASVIPGAHVGGAAAVQKALSTLVCCGVCGCFRFLRFVCHVLGEPLYPRSEPRRETGPAAMGHPYGEAAWALCSRRRRWASIRPCPLGRPSTARRGGEGPSIPLCAPRQAAGLSPAESASAGGAMTLQPDVAGSIRAHAHQSPSERVRGAIYAR